MKPKPHDEVADDDHSAGAEAINQEAFDGAEQRALGAGERERAGQGGSIPAEVAFERDEEGSDALEYGGGHQHQQKAGDADQIPAVEYVSGTSEVAQVG